jgi:hypothetical protein
LAGVADVLGVVRGHGGVVPAAGHRRPGDGGLVMMADIELLNALSVVARRLGLMGERDRLIIETKAVRDVPRCLRIGPFDKHSVRLLCSRPKGHESPCSWESAFVGIAESVAEVARRAGFAPGPESVTVSYDAVDWSAVEMVTDSPEIRCEVTQDGVRCVQVRGHEGDHRSAVKDMGYDTWPQSWRERHEAGCQMLRPVPPGFPWPTFSCNCNAPGLDAPETPKPVTDRRPVCGDSSHRHSGCCSRWTPIGTVGVCEAGCPAHPSGLAPKTPPKPGNDVASPAPPKPRA